MLMAKRFLFMAFCPWSHQKYTKDLVQTRISPLFLPNSKIEIKDIASLFLPPNSKTENKRCLFLARKWITWQIPFFSAWSRYYTIWKLSPLKKSLFSATCKIRSWDVIQQKSLQRLFSTKKGQKIYLLGTLNCIESFFHSITLLRSKNG